MKTNSSAFVRFIFGTTVLLALCIAGAGPPAQPTDPAAEQWVQDVEQAYANTQTYQSTGTASIVFQSPDGPEETTAKRATMNSQIAWDRPNRKLFMRVEVDPPAANKATDRQVMLLVSDGKKLRMRTSMYAGHHLEMDIPDPFNFKSISDIIKSMVFPVVNVELGLLIDAQVLADLTQFVLPPKLEKVTEKNQDTPGLVKLVYAFTGASMQIIIGIDPDQHLVHQIDFQQREEASTATMPYTIEIEKHNQPLDDALFSFDTTNSKAVGTLKELTQSASGGGAAPIAHPLQGQDAPPIELKTLTGQPFKLEDIDASVVVLDFWATWCPPCRQGLPLLQKFHEWAESNHKSVAVYPVNLQETPETVRGYWEQAGFTMPVLMDTQGSVAQAYQVQGIPQTVMIYNGKVASVHVGFSPDLDQLLQSEAERLLDDQSNSQPNDKPDDGSED